MTARRDELQAAFQLLRPRQWPVLSAQLAVGIGAAGLLGDRLAVPSAAADWPLLPAAWLAWVVLLNGGTLAFNSAYDRDAEPVAYLATPPPPPRWLAGSAVAWMGVGVAVGWLFVGAAFGLLTAFCVVLSLAYSHPAVRCKARPGCDLAINMTGYGAGTTLAGLLTGSAFFAGSGSVTALPAGAWWLVAGFACLFGSFYPLTQLYQLEADRRRGDRTLTSRIGVGGSLGLALALGVAAAGSLLAPLAVRWPLALVLAAWLGHIAWWFVRRRTFAPAAHERGMYRALALWAVADFALLVSLYLAPR
jgi:4-hydroxybenzoate polyprenyltransferase